MNVRILMLGDAAFTVEYPALSGTKGACKVRSLRTSIQQFVNQGRLDGIVDLISATRSLSVYLDPGLADFASVCEIIGELANEVTDDELDNGQLWRLPACYHGEYGTDLNDISHKSGLSPGEVINLHSSQIYDILLIGFLPGFPYMSTLPAELRFARRSNPRIRVPAGSVAIANDQTSIYPWESPGGWHLIARCPVTLFDPDWEHPSLLSAGGRVCFEPVSEQDYQTIADDLVAQRLSPSTFLVEKEK